MIRLIFVFLMWLTGTTKVTICHATGSETNPYVKIVVSVHSVDDATGLNGHGGHEDDAWRPFVFEDVTYPGQSAGLFGEEIDDDCEPIEVPTATVGPTDEPTGTSTDVATATPEEPTATPEPQTATATETPTDTPTVDSSPTLANTPTPTDTMAPTLVPTATATRRIRHHDEPTPTPLPILDTCEAFEPCWFWFGDGGGGSAHVRKVE